MSRGCFQLAVNTFTHCCPFSDFLVELRKHKNLIWETCSTKICTCIMMNKEASYLSRLLQSSKKVALPLYPSSGGRTQWSRPTTGFTLSLGSNGGNTIGVCWDARGRTASRAQCMREPVVESEMLCSIRECTFTNGDGGRGSTPAKICWPNFKTTHCSFGGILCLRGGGDRKS